MMEQPPRNLYDYWRGGPHPDESTHQHVATMLAFAFHVVESNFPYFRQQQLASSISSVPQLSTTAESCYIPITEYSPTEHYQIDKHLDDIAKDNLGGDCWRFRADIPHRYGWVCDTAMNASGTQTAIDDASFYTFTIPINVGGQGKVLINRLVSYDGSMGNVSFWFSSPYDPKINVFGDLAWNITSWHKDLTSIQATHVLQLPSGFAKTLETSKADIPVPLILPDGLFYESSSSSSSSSSSDSSDNDDMNDDDDSSDEDDSDESSEDRRLSRSNREKSSSSTILLNVELLRRSSRSASSPGGSVYHDKFKLLSVISC